MSMTMPTTTKHDGQKTIVQDSLISKFSNFFSSVKKATLRALIAILKMLIDYVFKKNYDFPQNISTCRMFIN